MTAATTLSGKRETEARPSVALGVVVAPGLTHDITAETAAELAEDLRRTHPSVEWQTDLVVDRLVEPPVPTSEIFEAARAMLLERDWDLGIVITDLPLRRGGRPMSHQLSPTYGIAILSLPALGAIHVRRRLRRTLQTSSTSSREAARTKRCWSSPPTQRTGLGGCASGLRRLRRSGLVRGLARDGRRRSGRGARVG